MTIRKTTAIPTNKVAKIPTLNPKPGRRPTRKHAIAIFVHDISNIKNTSDIEERCKYEILSLTNIKDNTLKTYIMQYRAAITQLLGNDHPSLNFLSASGLSSKITAEKHRKKNIIQTNNVPTISLTKPSYRKEAVTHFMQNLKHAKSEKKIRELWEKELTSLSTLSENTQKLYVSNYYRKELHKYFSPTSKVFSIIKLPEIIMDRINHAYRQKITEQHKQLVPVPQWQKLIKVATDTVTNYISEKTQTTETTMIVAAALLLLTGRRPYEIVCSGKFNPALFPNGTLKTRSKWSVMFEGQAKTKEASGTRYNTSYEIPVLAPAGTILDAISKLRTSKEGKKLSALNNQEFTTLTNSRGQDIAIPLRKMVEYLYRTHWPKDTTLSPKCLRPLYAEIAYKLFSVPSISKNSFFARILGHKENDLETSLSYMNYYLDDSSKTAFNAATRLQQRTLKQYEKSK